MPSGRSPRQLDKDVPVTSITSVPNIPLHPPYNLAGPLSYSSLQQHDCELLLPLFDDIGSHVCVVQDRAVSSAMTLKCVWSPSLRKISNLPRFLKTFACCFEHNKLYEPNKYSQVLISH